ncbi:MAG: hypothetical protein JXN64_06235 [Spirochaetes bacterium]|nr:hypothetical protein [Spirochaetota bacterium]
MLARYWRLRLKWDADQTLTYDNGARVDISIIPWKLSSGALSYGSEISEDLGFGAGETIADEGEVEGTVVDNTSNLYLGFKGILEMTADANSTDGYAYLYIEESADNTQWPSDADDFDITDLKLLAVLPFTTDAEDENRMVNFEVIA